MQPDSWQPPALSRAQLRELDRLAESEYGLPGIVLMENAGRGAAEHILALRPQGPVALALGPGNNGGDGWVVARHLAIAGLEVHCVSAVDPARLRGDAAIAAGAVLRMGLPVCSADETAGPAALECAQAELARGAVLVDALLGTGSQGAPRGAVAALIAVLAQLRAGRTLVALDLPSGLDPDSGAAQVCAGADLTLTFAAAKLGFGLPAARPWLGRVEIVGLGVPRELLVRVLGGHGGLAGP